MSLIRTAALCAIAATLTAGCQTASTHTAFSPASVQIPATPQQAETPAASNPGAPQQNLPVALPVVFQQPSGDVAQSAELPPQIPGEPELSLPEFVAEVQARNPSLEAMVAAWQAAAAKYPQAIALEDPMFNANIAPASIGSSTLETAYTLELSQKFPWFGKRDFRGRAASAEARSAFADVQDARLKLIETAESAFFDYYLVSRQQEVVRWDADVMREFRRTANTKYRANQVTQQDMLQADVELAQLERRQLELQKCKWWRLPESTLCSTNRRAVRSRRHQSNLHRASNCQI
jgi:cobalt-zinc-cadmium efflux system outer membrane protein